MTQTSIAAVEVAGRSFDELAGHTWTQVMEASRHGRYDAAKRTAMNELAERERGLRFNYDPWFNSLVPESWSGLAAGVRFQPEQFDVALARTQRLLVAAAHGDVPGSRMPEIIGLEPLAGPPDRILTDHCWVDVADVQRLVDEAAAPGAARVFASASGRQLVACLVATDAVRTPEQAHVRCMAALTHHPTAITPRHYVICRTAPPDPADPAAWSPPLAVGTGRA